MERLEIKVDFNKSMIGNTDPERPTFRTYLYTKQEDGKMILSELHFVDGESQVRPLGIYRPVIDIRPQIGYDVYSVEVIPEDQLPEVARMVHERNFD